MAVWGKKYAGGRIGRAGWLSVVQGTRVESRGGGASCQLALQGEQAVKLDFSHADGGGVEHADDPGVVVLDGASVVGEVQAAVVQRHIGVGGVASGGDNGAMVSPRPRATGRLRRRRASGGSARPARAAGRRRPPAGRSSRRSSCRRRGRRNRDAKQSRASTGGAGQ